jgi:hypothetical protein
MGTGRIDAKIAEKMASKEVLSMVLLPKWLDAGHIPIENRVGAEEIPTEASIGRPYGKSRLVDHMGNPE